MEIFDAFRRWFDETSNIKTSDLGLWINVDIFHYRFYIL